MFKNKTHFKVYLSIIIILVAAILIVGSNILNKAILDKEVKNVVTKSIESDDFKVSTKTWFSYQKVEKAIKEYMKDYSDKVKTINNILNEDKIKNILSASNLEKDGPLFSNSIEILNSNILEFNKTISELNKLNDNDKIMEYINKYNLDSKYIDMYKNYMFLNKDLDNNKVVIDELNNKGINILNNDLAVIYLLKNNPNTWVIKDKKIYFYSNQVMNEYNTLIQNIK